MSVNEKGIWNSENVYESEAMNQLNNFNLYTAVSPYVLSGKSNDIIKVTSLYTQVTPGETYYYVCQTDSEWSDGHGYNESRKGKVTIWLYLSKTYDPNNTGYDSPINFHSTSSNKVKDGVWRYTIPSGYNMARVRFNTYSNGTDTVTCKFWGVQLIPEKYYISSTPPQENSASVRMGEEFISAREFIEI